jgi:hypothetical protein
MGHGRGGHQSFPSMLCSLIAFVSVSESEPITNRQGTNFAVRLGTLKGSTDEHSVLASFACTPDELLAGDGIQMRRSRFRLAILELREEQQAVDNAFHLQGFFPSFREYMVCSIKFNKIVHALHHPIARLQRGPSAWKHWTMTRCSRDDRPATIDAMQRSIETSRP